jgi:hypothetical protein
VADADEAGGGEEASDGEDGRGQSGAAELPHRSPFVSLA